MTEMDQPTVGEAAHVLSFVEFARRNVALEGKEGMRYCLRGWTKCAACNSAVNASKSVGELLLASLEGSFACKIGIYVCKTVKEWRF